VFVLCVSTGWTDESQWAELKEKSVETADHAAQLTTEAAQAKARYLAAIQAATEAATNAATKEHEAALASAQARDTSSPDQQKAADLQAKIKRLQHQFDLANGMLIIAKGHQERGEAITAAELTEADETAKAAEALLVAARWEEVDLDTRTKQHLAAAERAETAAAAAAEADSTLKTLQAAADAAATSEQNAEKAADQANREAQRALDDYSKASTPSPKPSPPPVVVKETPTPTPTETLTPPPIETRQEALDKLLQLYLADKIDPAEYHEQRAKIIANPDLK
jgi:hypothetical protein